MYRIISSILNKICIRLNKISSLIYTSPHKMALNEWKKQNGELKRLDYRLSNNSIVFDIGGYEGQWASDIFAKYLCKIYVFEPVETFANNIKDRFKMNSNIFVFRYGLSDKNKVASISLLDNGSSVFRSGNKKESIHLRDITEVLQELNIKKIDLMKINIEGGEYELLERILESNLHKNIVCLQIQFHDVIPDTENRIKKIRSILEKTHHLTYSFPYIWENWEINDIQ